MGCETWLNHTVFDGEVLPENYKVYCKDRATLLLQAKTISLQLKSSDSLAYDTPPLSLKCSVLLKPYIEMND